MTLSLRDHAVAVLLAPSPADKMALTLEAAAAWKAGGMTVGEAGPPARPARPERPPLMLPRDMPRRSVGGPQGRVALLHALAHIELNAIDLAWDLIARFGAVPFPTGFFDDWVQVAEDEAIHFRLLADRLADFGAAYGDLPAHDGLWQAAEVTAGDPLARLAVVPMVLEARGLDVTPATIARFEALGDGHSAALLQRIFDDEITHVASGRRWFQWLCIRDGLDPESVYQDRVRRFFRGVLKAPFNQEARGRAGLPASYYLPLADDSRGA
ncbi:uncharacterized ferritin-like protein (DUF455 family) [Azospirillum fermentarium]|uniref:ferritin-like domain-containing protein n=1 Tax=Azospirillum fermentarium TaxID=1233114 RepID=UPI0022274429|nr:ferritin-like domain-containing protein [Azospirillum fermentarium]MCW2246027.1 uncharacterized ferritin-like protein (DUF455 family) [Azospirillum fermentarium]